MMTANRKVTVCTLPPPAPLWKVRSHIVSNECPRSESPVPWLSRLSTGYPVGRSDEGRRDDHGSPGCAEHLRHAGTRPRADRPTRRLRTDAPGGTRPRDRQHGTHDG